MAEIELNGELRLQYSYVYRYIDAVIKKIGESDLFLNGRYKRHKELFTGAIIAQMLSEDMGEYHYVTSPDKDPPDFTLRVLKSHEDDSTKRDEISYSFEVADYTEHSSSLEKVIDNKLAKDYPVNYSLVVLFKHSTETTFDRETLAKKYMDLPRWILVVMKTNQTNSGIMLPEPMWAVVSLSKPPIQRLIKLDKKDQTDIEQCWQQKGRGRNKTFSKRLVQLKLP